jgi:outer membrane protein OmpA-like peptidoglycan-associated protein
LFFALHARSISIELTGHSDARGSLDYNQKLSEKRTQSIADLLISEGINKKRIAVKAAGESSPIAINQYEDGSDAPEGRKYRTIILIFPSSCWVTSMPESF